MIIKIFIAGFCSESTIECIECCHPSLGVTKTALGSLVCCLAFGGGWRRFIDWLYVIVKVFIVGFCSVITVHTPTCRDLIFCRLLLSAILATVCCCSIDWWRRPIEQLYVIVKMLISGFCSESTVGCCHLAYRVRRKLRPHMRKLQTLRLLDWLKPNCLL